MEKLICSTCSVGFIPSRVNNTKYCSRKCCRKAQVKKYKQSLKKKCSYCSKLIDSRSIKCRNCSPEKELTLLQYQQKDSVKDKHPSWTNAHVRHFARSWNRDLKDLPCQQCGYGIHIELCHIKAVQSFDKLTKLGEINHPSNILVLCPNCHWEFDNGHLTLDQIPPRIL